MSQAHQALLFEECARVRRRVKLDGDMVRVTFRVARSARDEAVKLAEAEGTTLSELTRDCWYEARGIGELDED